MYVCGAGTGSRQALPGLLPAYLASDFGGMREALEACLTLNFIYSSTELVSGLVNPSLSLSLPLISISLYTLSSPHLCLQKA